MASSLEELLAEEGFKGRRSMTRPRSSFGLESLSMPLHRHRNSDSRSGVKIRTERTRSDVSRYNLRVDSPTSNWDRRPRDNLVRRGKPDEGSKKETGEGFEGSGSRNVQEGKRPSVDRVHGFPGSEIIEVGEEENDQFKDIYSDELYSSERGREKERPGNNIKVDERISKNASNNLFGRAAFRTNNRHSMKEPGTSNDTSHKSSWNSKSFEDKRSQRRDKNVEAVSPALDEVAVQAMVSILNGYINRFIEDVAFRVSLRDSCFSSLDFIELEEGNDTHSKIISNLEEAIKTVERAAEESATAKDLKKASLKLSVITGLNSDDMKDGFTSGVPNYKLSACAHAYLSVTYKLQKKDRLSAKHLLQVFCNSPFQARTDLLPELWDYLFFPHLSHLKTWYNQEADALIDTPSKPRKLKLLEKVYNEILDSGTYQFAVYYKDWLTEGVEAPSIPLILIPSVSVRGVSYGYSSEQASPAGPFSPQPMVSKMLYDAVFSHAYKFGVEDVEDDDDDDEENFDSCLRTPDGSVVEDREAVTDSLEAVNTNQDMKENTTINASHMENGLILTLEEAHKLDELIAPGERVLDNEIGGTHIWKGTTGRSHVLHTPPHTTVDELTLKSSPKSIFELQQNDSSVNHTVTTSLHSIEPIKISSCSEELRGSCDYYNKGSFSASIPLEFMCPLTKQLFEDPVTLETGQTFERAAIGNWFNKGNRTCPVTGKTLECLAVPLTNFVLKRVIDNWKSDHRRHLLDFSSQVSESSMEYEFKPEDVTAVILLQKLLTGFSEEEKITNTKHLMSLGGLQFLFQRFEYGNLEEKAHVAALLSCCIEADPSCRYHIARNIRQQCLLDLLHSKQVKARANAALLMTELICLNRRKEVKLFLSGLQKEGIVNTMHVLLMYLQSLQPEQKPLVAVLILHFDLLLEHRKYSIYREEAVDAIVEALEHSLTDEKVRAKCCSALLILGGDFSISGKVLTEDYILKQAGYNDCSKADILDNDNEGLTVNESMSLDDEEQAEWLRILSASLLGTKKRSFLDSISKCLGSGNLDLVRVCLTTVSWLSYALTSVSNAEFQLSAFSALISRLKECLENGERVEHKILASMSLLNFSKIPECRVLLMTIAEEIVVPLRGLAEKTWTAKELYATISGGSTMILQGKDVDSFKHT